MLQVLKPEGQAIRVFLLAENRFLRESLARVLARRPDLIVAGTSSFSEQALEELGAAQCDILLVDSSGASFFEVVAEAVRAYRVKVVMIGMAPDRDTFFRAVRVGVVGYVLKDASAAELVAAVRSVASGDAVCPPGLTLALFEYVARQWREAPTLRIKSRLGFTRREQQLVPLIARSLTNKEIASHLGVSEQTVKNHIHRMLRKLGTGDRFTVVEACRAEGWVTH